MHYLLILGLSLFCFILGAWLDHRYHDRAAAPLRKERDQLIADYRELITKAHDERDAVFAKFHTRAASPGPTPTTIAASPAPIVPAAAAESAPSPAG